MVCRWLVWPHAGTELQLVLFMVPFILVGTLLYAHRLTAQASFDYSMGMLLLLHPAYPLQGSAAQSLALALAVLFAPFFALLAYTLVFPANAHKRLHVLRRMMIHELQDMARSPSVVKRRRVWRVRLYHRLLKLALWADRSHATTVVVDGALAVMRVGEAIVCAHRLAGRARLSHRAQRRVQLLLKRLQQLEREPERAAQSCRRVAAVLVETAPRQAAIFSTAGAQLQRHLGFFTSAQ
jgi:hypothetical protein